MPGEDVSTRERILDATVKLLFTTSRADLTIRRIAQEAGVNVAAINYHFRSKEELVNKAMEAATAAAFEKGIAVLLAPGRDPMERLRDFLTGYANGLVRFPDLTRTAFLGLFQADDSRTFYGRCMREMLQRVGEVIAEVAGQGAAGDRHSTSRTTTALRVLSCVIFPFLLSSTLRETGAVDYSNEEARTLYIETSLATLVGRSGAGREPVGGRRARGRSLHSG